MSGERTQRTCTKGRGRGGEVEEEEEEEEKEDEEDEDTARVNRKTTHRGSGGSITIPIS